MSKGLGRIERSILELYDVVYADLVKRYPSAKSVSKQDLAYYFRRNEFYNFFQDNRYGSEVVTSKLWKIPMSDKITARLPSLYATFTRALNSLIRKNRLVDRGGFVSKPIPPREQP